MDDLWGTGSQLAAQQMAVRAAAMVMIVIVLVRLGGARLFSHKSSFDNVVAIMLGAIAARGVVGASPFGATLAACATLVALHRALGWLTVQAPRLERLVKGRSVCLYHDGQLDQRNLSRTTISEHDLMESLRLETQGESLAEVEAAYLERNGRISFILRRRGQ
jgi:uncharacterized membrane protein YcaP (DUF421 family)